MGGAVVHWSMVFPSSSSSNMKKDSYNSLLMGQEASTAIAKEAATTTTTTLCEPGVVYRGPVGVPPLGARVELGHLLQARRLRDGAEVGVQRGLNAKEILSKWTSCASFKLIDLWSQQDQNYMDRANVNNTVQNQYYAEAVTNLKAWEAKTEFLKMYSTEAAEHYIADVSLDFVYLDARHDYCGVKEDLLAYWPKLRPGGIMAGHDFLDAATVHRQDPQQDWSLCSDGLTKHPGAVRGAVEEFAAAHGLSVAVTYREPGKYPSWILQKPTRMECVDPTEMGAYSHIMYSSEKP